jgi:hypothetical protein
MMDQLTKLKIDNMHLNFKWMMLSDSRSYDYDYNYIERFVNANFCKQLNIEQIKKIWLPLFLYESSKYFDDKEVRAREFSKLEECLSLTGLTFEKLGLEGLTEEDLAEKKEEIV